MSAAQTLQHYDFIAYNHRNMDVPQLHTCSQIINKKTYSQTKDPNSSYAKSNI